MAGQPMFNKGLIRPYFWGGGGTLGGNWLISHNLYTSNLWLLENSVPSRDIRMISGFQGNSGIRRALADRT